MPGTDLVLEIDSARYHASLLDRERDARRDAGPAAAVRRVLRLPEEDVWHAPGAMIRRVEAACRRAA